MPVAEKMAAMLESQSFIRKMFEEGARLKAEYGAENVFDFSLGNPDVPPPEAFKEVLGDLAADEKLSHGYMPNAGWPHVRAAVAAYLSQEQGVALSADYVCMTTGAAGALNCAVKALFNPGEEMLTPAPYFVEYGTYVDNHGGKLVTVDTDEKFRLNLAALEAAITPRTRAVLLNSPHNPTGVVYSMAELKGLADILERASRRLGRRLYLISDEPYRKIVFDGLEVPSLFEIYAHTLIGTSYSKDLSLPGERIGFLAVHPEAEDAAQIIGAAVLANRCLGFVNAPSLAQLTVGRLQGACVDASIYERRRDLLCQGLGQMGYEFVKPQGAFYLFPKSPLADEVKFVDLLKAERILVVPGRGFGRAGYFRIAFCVSEATISAAMDGFRRALART